MRPCSHNCIQHILHHFWELPSLTHTQQNCVLRTPTHLVSSVSGVKGHLLLEFLYCVPNVGFFPTTIASGIFSTRITTMSHLLLHVLDVEKSQQDCLCLYHLVFKISPTFFDIKVTIASIPQHLLCLFLQPMTPINSKQSSANLLIHVVVKQTRLLFSGHIRWRTIMSKRRYPIHLATYEQSLLLSLCCLRIPSLVERITLNYQVPFSNGSFSCTKNFPSKIHTKRDYRHLRRKLIF